MFLSFDKAALPSLPQWRRIAGITAMACASLWLAGCAGVRTIDSDVQSYSTLQQLPSPPTYRLQLLPSQIALGPQFDTVVQQAEASLAGVGLRRDDAQGSVIAQIDAQARYIPDSWLMPGSPLEFGPMLMSCGNSDKTAVGRPRLITIPPE